MINNDCKLQNINSKQLSFKNKNMGVMFSLSLVHNQKLVVNVSSNSRLSILLLKISPSSLLFVVQQLKLCNDVRI